jgi:hypothetical protein
MAMEAFAGEDAVVEILALQVSMVEVRIPPPDGNPLSRYHQTNLPSIITFAFLIKMFFDLFPQSG